ncbi:Sec1 family domain-containing protein 1, partial [Fragariocoptes setiger]
MLSVRRRHINVAESMLNLNSDAQSDWKLLIYDDIGQDILSPLFSVKELRNFAVTLHMLINSERDAIPDVAAIYFVQPTDENIARICKDLEDRLYDSYYLNFISPISRQKLETIATASLQAESAACIKKVYDQYLNFISLEDDLFVLRESHKDSISYTAINRNDACDEEIKLVVDSIVDSLFSVFVTLGAIPIIRCPKGNAAEVIAEKLAKKIRENLRDTRNSLFESHDRQLSSLIGIQRPLLIILDRSIDMSTPLHHTWTYQALIHDLLNTRLNQVTVVESDNPNPQYFDLNPKDRFWNEQRGRPFPQVAEAVQEELEEYRKNEDEVKRLKNSMGLDGSFGDETTLLLSESTAKLTNAVSSLPELLENKRVIGMHTTIATAALEKIKQRKLDNFFETEEKIMNRTITERSILDEMICDPQCGLPADKYRLFLISYICDNPALSEDEAEKYMQTLVGLGCNRGAFDYIKKWKTFARISVKNLQSSYQTSGGGTRTVSMFSKLMLQGSQFVMEGVKNLVLKEHKLPITKIVDALMEGNPKSDPAVNEYTYLDPKLSKDQEGPEHMRKRNFQEAIVFVAGGGNYIEYQNLVDYCKSKSKTVGNPSASRHIIYGSTDLVNAEQFLKQLEKLGCL